MPLKVQNTVYIWSPPCYLKASLVASFSSHCPRYNFIDSLSPSTSYSSHSKFICLHDLFTSTEVINSPLWHASVGNMMFIWHMNYLRKYVNWFSKPCYYFQITLCYQGIIDPSLFYQVESYNFCLSFCSLIHTASFKQLLCARHYRDSHNYWVAPALEQSLSHCGTCGCTVIRSLQYSWWMLAKGNLECSEHMGGIRDKFGGGDTKGFSKEVESEEQISLFIFQPML